MSRMRIDKNGIAVARQGHDVNTAAEKDMLFSRRGVAARVYETGLATVTPYAERYNLARVTFSKTFAKPPVVFAAGLRSDSGIDVTPVVYMIYSSDYARIHPHYSLEIDTTGFWLYVGRAYGSSYFIDVPTTWRYWVLENTLDS